MLEEFMEKRGTLGRTAKRVVITGGPSAGKTTLLEILRNSFPQLAFAPEAANALFTSGHPRPRTYADRMQTQRAIYELQNRLEDAANRQAPSTYIFCDRGTLDGASYWPGALSEFCAVLGTTLEGELNRYSAVIHLQTAAAGTAGYQNTPVRIETPEEALVLDARLGEIWARHPRYFFIPNCSSFEEKLDQAMNALAPFLPEAAPDYAAALVYPPLAITLEA